MATEFNGVALVIQQAVAPVFLLTGVGAILGVLTNRLARVVDRFRELDPEETKREMGTAPIQAKAQAQVQVHPRFLDEHALLLRRRRWIQRAITLCTLCALLVCLVIAVLFLASEMGLDPARAVAVLFVSGMACLIAGLLCFLREIALAAINLEER